MRISNASTKIGGGGLATPGLFLRRRAQGRDLAAGANRIESRGKV